MFESSIVWYYRLVAANTLATFQLHQGLDPAGAIAAGREALKEALRLTPRSPATYVEAARLALMEAAWAARAGRSDRPSLARALVHAEHAVQLDTQLAKARFTAAEVCVQIATARPSPAIVERGIDHVDKALKLNPRLRKAQDVRAALLGMRVR